MTCLINNLQSIIDFRPDDYMNTLIQNIKYKLISKISPFMTQPNQLVNQAQQFLHITGSEDLNVE